MIDLLNLEPNKVSKDLKNYIIGMYGNSGAGKTTTASKFGNSLIIGTELGFKTLPGVYAQPALDWISFLTIINQLKKQEVKDKFDTIIIDTIGALTKHAEKFVLDRFGAKDLNDSQALPYGKGHTELEKMFYNAFTSIQKEGYGIVIVGHEKSVVDKETEEQFMDINIANKRIKQYIVSMLDVLMYVEKTRDPAEPNIVYFKTTEKAEAKSRFPNIVPKIEFNYENVEKAILDSVGDDAIEGIIEYREENEDFSKEEFEELARYCEEKGKAIIAKDESKFNDVVQTIERTLGKKIGEATLRDVPLLRILKDELDQIDK